MAHPPEPHHSLSVKSTMASEMPSLFRSTRAYSNEGVDEDRLYPRTASASAAIFPAEGGGPAPTEATNSANRAADLSVRVLRLTCF
jgi:hypothetical protein